MKLKFLSSWQFEFFPSLTWFAPGIEKRMLTLFLLLILFSILYFILIKVIERFSSERRKKLLGTISNLYMIGIIFVAVQISVFSLSVPFPPVYILIGIFWFVLGLLIVLSGRWIISKVEANISASLSSYLKVNFWLASQMSSHFLIPLIFFQMPVFNRYSQTFYWGIPILMLIIYLCYFKVLLSKLFSLLDLNVPLSSLPEDLKEKFLSACESVFSAENLQIFIAKEGLYNGVALYPSKKIVIGIDVIKHLTVEENKATLIHELGHLKDKRFLPAIHRNSLLGDVFIFLFVVFLQLKTFPYNGIFGIGCLLAALYWSIFRITNIRLKAEFVADKYVKDFDEDMYTHLISGLEKLYYLNVVDKNFCKKRHAGHLDIDEREQMISEGQFKVRPKFRLIKVIVATFLVTLAVIIGLEIICSEFLPSNTDKWRKLHKKFHQQKDEYQYTEAIDTIKNALQVSKQHFGEIHEKTYISLNDLTEVYIDLEQWDEAAKAAQKAVEIGQKLYEERNIEYVQSIKNLGRIYYYQEDYTNAGKWFTLALKTQTALSDEKLDIANTFHWLGAIYKSQNKNDKAISNYKEMLKIYEDIGDNQDSYLLIASQELAKLLAEKGQFAEAEQLFQKALFYSENSYGNQSEEFADLLLDIGYFYYQKHDYKSAEEYCFQSLDIYKMVFGEEHENYAYALYKLGEVYNAQGQYGQAEEVFLKVLKIDEKVYGTMDSALTYEIWELAQINETKGDLLTAKELYQRIADIGESSDEVGRETRIETYKKLISIASSLGNTDEINEIEKKLENLQKQE